MGATDAIIVMTKGEVDAAAERAASTKTAALRERTVPGAVLLGAQGKVIGTVKEIDMDFLILTTAQGDFRLPVAAIALDANGLTIGLSALDFKNAMNARHSS
jgi:hypothetical protein